ncbi:MAG: hypothetical protein FOGNACKC_00942 [Anaerolineae bacterium]|nr:hypothetical protein [Anaerolineae bacterium]
MSQNSSSQQPAKIRTPQIYSTPCSISSSPCHLAVGLLTHDILYVSHGTLPPGIVTGPHYVVIGDVAELVYCAVAGHMYQDDYDTATFDHADDALRRLRREYGDWRSLWQPIIDRWRRKNGITIKPKLGVWIPQK